MATDEQYLNIVMESFESSRDTYMPAFKGFNRHYKLYRAWKLGKAIPYRNNIAVPILFSLVQSDAAKKVNLTLPPDNTYVAFAAGGPEDQKLARKRTALINPQMVDAETFDKCTKLFVGADIFGISFFEWGWETRNETVKFRADLGGGEEIFQNEEMTFDGPNWWPLDVRRCFPQPGIASPRDWSWFVNSFYMDLDDVKLGAKRGFFDKKPVADLEFNPGSLGATGKDEYLIGANPATGGLSELDFKRTKHEKPIEIMRYRGRVPLSMAIKGEVNLDIWIANRHVVLKARPNPFNRINVGMYAPMPDPWHLHAPSKVEVAAKLQIATNAMASQKIDVLQLFADPQFFYNKRMMPPNRRLRSFPGAWHGFDGPPQEAIMPVIPDLRGTQNLYTELEQQMQWMEQGTGVIRDTIQGMGGPDRETARAFLGRQEAANTRLLMEARLVEKQLLEPIATRFVELNRMFLPFPRQLRILGGDALFDPITLQPMVDDSIEINDLLPDYDARAVGTLSGMSKPERLQSLVMLMQLASTNPMLIQLTNWVALWRSVLRMADVPNPDELMGTDSAITQAVQQQMAMVAANGGTSGASKGGQQNSQLALPLGG